MTTSTTASSKNNAKRGVKIWAVALWLVIWQLAAMAVNQEILLVSPVSMLGRWFELISEADFWSRVAFSSLRIFEGLILGVALGSALGVLASRFEWVKDLMTPLISVIRAIPVASFIILALAWVSEKSLSAFISFMICFPVFYTNVLNGAKSVDKHLTEMANVFKLSGIKRFRYIFVPAVFPYLKTAFNVSVGLAWKSGTAAELITVPNGSIGELLHQAKIFLETADNLAWAFTIILLSLLFEGACRVILSGIERALKGR